MWWRRWRWWWGSLDRIVNEIFIPTFECLKLEKVCNLSNFSNATHPTFLGALVMHETWTVKTAVMHATRPVYRRHSSLIFIDDSRRDDIAGLVFVPNRKIPSRFLLRPPQKLSKVSRFMFLNSDVYVQKLYHIKAVINGEGSPIWTRIPTKSL